MNKALIPISEYQKRLKKVSGDFDRWELCVTEITPNDGVGFVWEYFYELCRTIKNGDLVKFPISQPVMAIEYTKDTILNDLRQQMDENQLRNFINNSIEKVKPSLSHYE